MKKITQVFIALLVTCCMWQTNAQIVQITPTNPSVGNCIAFGSTDFGPITGYVYQNVPTFQLNTGDLIKFDLGLANDIVINRDIYFAIATVNGGDIPVQWVQVASASDTPTNPFGNNIVGDFELTYTATSSFNFAGGGLLVAFDYTNSNIDTSCDQVGVITNSSDPSGNFVKRFYQKSVLVDGESVITNAGTDTGFIVGIRIEVSSPSITCPSDIIQDNDLGNCSAVVNYSAPTTTTNPALPPATVAGFTTLGVKDGRTFYLSDATYTGVNAFNDAVVNGGFVATVTSAEVNTFIRDKVAEIANTSVLIGYTDVSTEGAFVWQSGNPSVYTNWNPGEPNNSGDEDYTELLTNANGFWNDLGVGASRRYVLELNGGVEQTAGLPSGSTFNVGTTTNTFIVTDANGNTATCSFDVTVNDTEAPVAICQDGGITVQNIAIVSNSFGGPLGTSLTNNGYNVVYNSNVLPSTAVLANTDVVFLIRTDGNPDLANWVQAGGLLITEWSSNVWALNTANLLQATDSGGGSIGTDTPITFTNTTVGQALGNNLPNPYSDGGATEYARDFTAIGGSVEIHATRPGNIPVIIGGNAGQGYVLAIAYDYQDKGASLPGSPTEQLLLNTLTAPILGSPIILQLDANGMVSITPADIDGGSTDNCGIATSTVSPSTFDCSNIGENTVTLTVTDASGNSSSCTTTVTIEDNIAPVITCVPNATRNTDLDTCQYTIVGTELDATFTDNCPNGTITNNFNNTATLAGEVLPKGDTTVIWTVDDGNGQTATCTTVITVEDNQDPVITCIPNATRNTDLDVCQYTVVGTEFDATFTDNCADGTITNNLNNTATLAGVILPKGVTSVIWTVNDGNGQTATCTTVITVEDNQDPVITCVPNAIRDTDAGVCQYTVVGTEFDATFTDNCTDGTITNNLNGTTTIAGEVLLVGDTTVIWTVNDGNGQTATCTTVITVEDNEAPIIACPSDIVVSTTPGDCFAEVFFADAIAVDNCGINSVVQTMGDPSGSMFPVGVTTIEYTATDDNGNTTTCSFTITVVDNEPAIAICQNITIQLDEFGNASIVAEDVDGGSTDSCGVANLSIDVDTFDCSNVGPNNVVLTVTDVNGNTSNCTAIVTVEDVTAPEVLCMDITVQLDASGTVTILGSDVDGGSTDICGIASYDLDIDTFDCSNVGTNNVTLTVTDVNGNTSTCVAVVTVEDITMPELICMDITLELGEDGTASINPEDVLASATDACGIVTTAVDIENFDCSDIGTPVTVMVFAVDTSGNLASCTAVVTVVDALAPVITCPADQSVDPGTGNLFYVVPDYFATGEATATDNCTDPVTIISQNPAAGSLLPDGTYTITLTAEDAYGNVSNCDFELIVDSLLGVQDVSVNMGSIILYPNPSKDYVVISNPQNIALESAAIYDITGRLIKTIILTGMGSERSIDISELASANYMFIINSAQGQITKQIIKE